MVLLKLVFSFLAKLRKEDFGAIAPEEQPEIFQGQNSIREGQRDAFASQEDIEGDLIIGLIAVGNDNSSYYI